MAGGCGVPVTFPRPPVRRVFRRCADRHRRGYRGDVRRSVDVARRFLREFQRDDAPGLSAELAYRFLFAIFPFGIFLAALAGFAAQWAGIRDPTGQILEALGGNVPGGLDRTIRPQLEAVLNTRHPELLSIGAIAALWAATGGTQALMKAMNRAFEVEEGRPFLARYVAALGLTLLASTGIVVAVVGIVGASLVTEEAANRAGIGPAAFHVFGVVRWPAVFALLAVAVGTLYRLAPNARAPWRWCLGGGAIFAILWLAMTALLAFYVSNFGTYGNTYGALAGVIVLMLWFYLSSLVLIATAELVAVLLKELQPERVEEARAATGARRTSDRSATSPEAPPRPPPAAPA